MDSMMNGRMDVQSLRRMQHEAFHTRVDTACLKVANRYTS